MTSYEDLKIFDQKKLHNLIKFIFSISLFEIRKSILQFCGKSVILPFVPCFPLESTEYCCWMMEVRKPFSRIFCSTSFSNI
ncbi:hypothetical protein BpHYR1_046722 [Brachionus plicatilis]|uniref:Uncharacterized protein n=1 Tax=Brachionus plicatilis TaxID=10195 RepID=A0A3M7SDW5_BRAPC|nr:hypothetical protein BpHYR1_046722 [Brachionus plicatilis]